jgi:protein-disulfide isomerase
VRIKHICNSVFAFCVVLAVPQIAPAQQQDGTVSTDIQDDISMLKRDVGVLLHEQRQIIDELHELKQSLPANMGTRSAPQLPATLDVKGESFKGDAPARVAIVEFSDFECPFCEGYERETSPQIFESYLKTGKVKLFYRDLPLPMHPHALQAARAAHCAGEQGKYWEMHDSLFAKQNALSDPALLDRAKTLGLDTQKFGDCFSSDKYKDELQKYIAGARELGVQATPTFFIGTIDSSGDVVNITKRIVGAKPYADFQAALDEALASKNPDAVSAH